MSTQVEVVRSSGTVAGRLTEEQLALIKRAICRPRHREATDDELALFRYQCERTGLDPFSNQIYAVFRRDSRSGEESMTIQVGIDGLRLIAERTGKYLGQDGPYWCGEDGVWRDTWIADTPPAAAKVIAKKVGPGGLVAETGPAAHTREYRPRTGGLWAEKPALMIAKCAEALALRKAFPNDTSGLYIAEEMERADDGERGGVAVERSAAPLAAGNLPPPTPAERAATVAMHRREARREPEAAPPGTPPQQLELLPPERVDDLVTGLRTIQADFGRIKLWLNRVGAREPLASSPDSVRNALRYLNPEQAKRLEALIGTDLDQLSEEEYAVRTEGVELGRWQTDEPLVPPDERGGEYQDLSDADRIREGGR